MALDAILVTADSDFQRIVGLGLHLQKDKSKPKHSSGYVLTYPFDNVIIVVVMPI